MKYSSFLTAGLLTCSVFLTAVVFSCSNDQRRSIESFYYPLNELDSGLVYEYRSVNIDSLAPEFWYFRAIDLDSVVYLTGQFYDAEFVIRQFFRAEVVSDGMIMQEYFLYSYDSLGQTQRVSARIDQSTIFPFRVLDSSRVYVFSLQWPDPQDASVTTTLVRNRRYLRDTIYTFNGQHIDCVDFFVKDLIEIEQEGVQSIEYNGRELYAKNIGLVYYRKEVPGAITLEYELADRYPMDEFVEKYEQDTVVPTD